MPCGVIKVSEEFRKIRKNELKKAAGVLAECFKDYPLYNGFFPDDEKKEKRVFYFFWYRLITRFNYTYVSDDLSMICVVKDPKKGDKDVSPLSALLHPLFLFGFFKNIPIKALKAFSEFSKVDTAQKKKFYDPEKDVYMMILCVAGEKRSGGSFMKIVSQYNTDSPIYCETHSENNMLLYNYLKFKTLDTVYWRGIPQYAMKKEAKNDAD